MSITDLANSAGSGAISEAGNIMTGPIGYIVYFALGVTLISVVIVTIKRFL